MWENQEQAGRGGEEAWKPEFKPLETSSIRQEEEDEARRNKERGEQRLNNKEKPKEVKGLRRLIFIMSDALEFEKDEN